MKPWNRFEQFFKHKQLYLFEKMFGYREMTPDEADWTSIERILIVRQHDQLGDFLLATPVFKAVRQRFPNAHISVVARKYTAAVAEANETIDAVIPFYEHGTDWTWRALRRVLALFRHKSDLVIVLNTVSHSLTSDLIGRWAARRYVLGSEHRRFQGTTRNFFYNLIAPYRPEEVHQSQRNLDIVRYIGIAGEDLREHMRLRQEEVDWAKRHLLELGWRPERPLIAIHPGAGKAGNRWPVENFAQAATRLAQTGNAQLYLTWGQHEGALGERLRAALTVPAISSLQQDIRKLAAILSLAQLFLCNDTGVMHVGAAVGTPLVAIFGPTNPALWKPWGDSFVAVRAEDHLCASVTVEKVVTESRALLSRKRFN